MYLVSEAYKTEMNRPVRNITEVEITFGVSNPDAPYASTLLDNGHAFYSNTQSIDLGINVSNTYDTLEHNRFVLSGYGKLLDTDNLVFDGYIGNEICGADGVFVAKPTIEITFSQFFEFGGFTIQFDHTKENYPTEVRIQAFNNTTEVHNILYANNRNRFIAGDTIPECNKLLLTFDKMNVGNRRMRVFEIIYGIIDTLYTKDISKCSFSSDVDVIGNSLPKYSLSFDIFDVENKYDPENPDSLFRFIEQGQSAKFFIKQLLDDGTYEKIPVCNGFTSGGATSSSGGYTKVVSVPCSSVLDLLDFDYDEAIYTGTPRSMWDLANDVMTFAGYSGTLLLDEILKTIYTTIPLPVRPVRECLQLIAQASNCAIFVDRNGQINIKRLVLDTTEYTLDFSKMKEIPASTRTPVLRNIISSYNTLTVDTSSTKLASIDVVAGAGKVYTIEYSTATNISYVLSGVSLIGTPKIYSNKMEIEVYGTGSITVNGYYVKSTKIKVSTKYREIGSDLSIENELIDNETFLETYCDNINEYYLRRNSYSFGTRGYPEIDLLDNTTIQTNYDGYVGGNIVKTDLEFNGALSGSNTVLALKE